MATFRMVESKKKTKENAVKELKDLFGGVLHVDIIKSVAASCNFDVHKSSDLLLELTSNVDDRSNKKRENQKIKKQSPQHNSPKKTQPTPPVSRLRPAVSSNAISNRTKKAERIEAAVRNIRNGYKVLIILRGLPGSGKSYLAKGLTDATLGPGSNYHHILSTDDYFEQAGTYLYEVNKLQEAHQWNHQRAFTAMSKGLSPVIIDNTNTQMWEMKPYAMMATDYGYIIEIIEPDTWWCFNDKELARRNSHGVSRNKIKDMLDRYEKNVSPQKLLCAYSLMYKFQKPPQFRVMPPLMRHNTLQQNGYVNFSCEAVEGLVKSKSASALNRQSSTDSSRTPEEVETINLMDFNDDFQENVKIQDDDSNSSFWDLNPVDQILMCTEDNASNILQPNLVKEEHHPVPPTPENANFFGDLENAWGVDEKALQSWDIVTPLQCEANFVTVVETHESPKDPEVETVENATNVELSDFQYLAEGAELPDGFKIVQTEARDINSAFKVRHLFKVPKKLMVDKSCLTDEIVIVDDRDEESQLRDLKILFTNIPRPYLKELYENCCKDFNWTVNVLLDDNKHDLLDQNKVVDDDVIEENQPSQVSNEEPVTVESLNSEDESKETKTFKRKIVSEESIQLKKCLESKIDINKEHYSDHILKVKQSKFGTRPWNPEPEPSTSACIDLDSDSDNDSSCKSDDDPKNMVELNLGEDFVAQLELKFGNADMGFPQGFQPVVQVPVTLARQLYTFYVESICQQMEAQNNVLDRLVNEDEEFARKLQAQEEAKWRPQEKPLNFTEIMDEQVAVSLHKKDVEQWKNMTVDNLAARLTRQKLFSIFPNVNRDVLLEILHAYNNDYNKTVEDLVVSVGSENINGSREVIMEPPLTQAALAEMRQAEKECKDFQESEELQPPTFYREEANKHLQKREELYQKAQSYYQKGMTEVAMFYSELAKKETRYFDKANHIAATAFLYSHSQRLQKFDTLDLHYLYVKEAIPALDLFIDRSINLLRGERKTVQELFIITGRGNRSEGGLSRIKPAVITRLKKRQIGFVALNPGLLKIKVNRNSLMTSDLP